MRHIMRRFSITLMTILLLVCSIIPVSAAKKNVVTHPRILILSSYAYDWDSVPDQLDGIASVLGTKAKMDYVFMDTKKHTYDEVKNDVYEQIKSKMKSDKQFDAVILEDDAALDFALEYRDKVFAGVPLVFEGINTKEKANLATKDPLITGMIEYFPYKDTIQLAKNLYPDATKIVGISDNTESGIGCTKRFYDEEKNFKDLKFSDINTSTMTEAQIKKKLASYDESTILVFLSMMNDVNGNIYSLLEATEFTTQSAKIPIFKCDYLGVGEGILGGYVSSYKKMGQSAAKMVLKILNGTSPSDIPVQTMDGYPIFDQKMLDQYHIKESLLPKDATIVNYVPTFYEQYKTVIWPAGTIIFLLILIFVFITINNKRKAEVIQAENASRSKSDFLAKMSHEIRTPMNAIIGETTLAQKNLGNISKMEEYLQKIMISSKHLLNLINDILDMSAIESNKIKIAHAQFDIKEVVSTITTLYYSQCQQKDIHFEAKLDHLTTEILIGDQLRLQQSILNLLSNSLKFTKPGGEIAFSLAQRSTSDDTVMLSVCVSDTGCGMSEEYMSRIFKPFEQETSLTAKEHGGSGLGLSITKNLIELMGGTIDVKSTVDVGTSISFEIPFLKAPEQLSIDNQDISSMKAIIIDDDEDTVSYTSSILNHIGIVHDCAFNGEDALYMITKARNDKKMYSLCLIDWKMEGMSGLELTKKIRSACGEDPIVVIASAYDLNEITGSAEDAGVDACIPKPLFQSTVFNILMSVSHGKLVKPSTNEHSFDFSGRTALLVDDTEINREIASELLEMVGFQVVTASDGQKAVDTFYRSERGTYDVILMDVQMPVMNGYEATKTIRSLDHPDAKDILIIAMTANAFAEDIAKSLDAGMNDHISKPIDTELMYQVLSRYLH